MKDSKTGLVLGDTIITGMLITLEDGSTQFLEIKEPVIYKTVEENNKR